MFYDFSFLVETELFNPVMNFTPDPLEIFVGVEIPYCIPGELVVSPHVCQEFNWEPQPPKIPVWEPVVQPPPVYPPWEPPAGPAAQVDAPATLFLMVPALLAVLFYRKRR